MLAEQRRTPRGDVAGGAEDQGGGGHEVRPHARVVERLPHRVAGRAAWVVADELGEGLVGRPRHRGSVERVADLTQIARREPRAQDGGEEVPCAVAVALQVEVDIDRALDGGDGVCQAGGLAQRGPLAGRQGDHHDAAPVAGGEVVTERAVEVVAVLRLVLAPELRLGDPSEVADHRERDVGERHTHELPAAVGTAVTLGGQEPDRRVQPERDVPRGKHAVQRVGLAAGPGRGGEAGRGVHGVVHLGGAVAVALQRDHDEVLPAGTEPLVGQPPAFREVRQQRPGPRDELADQLPALVCRQVDGEGPLALVHPGPEQALPARRKWPAAVVQPPFEPVEADHVGAELRECHPAQRRGDERRALHDA